MAFNIPQRHRRCLSPPPSSLSIQTSGTQGSIKRLSPILLEALEDMCQHTSLFHRVVVLQLLVVVVAVELLRPAQTDPLLAILLGLVKVALVADCTSIMTGHLSRLSRSSQILAFLLYRAPLITGPFAELALFMLILRGKAPSTARTVLAGSVYTKLLVIGALCFVSSSLSNGLHGVDMHKLDFAIVPRLLGLAGVLVLASAPHIESHSYWISQGVPLFFILHISLSFYFGSLKASELKRRAQDDRVSGRPSSKTVDNRHWIASLICLGALKTGAVLLVHSLLDHANALAAVTVPTDGFGASGSFIEFTVIPLAITAVDHLTDIKAALDGDLGWSWLNLTQSMLQTYFFVRPLAAVAGHNIDPSDGRIGVGLCLLATAVWSSLPGIPRFIKGIVLMLAYGFLTFSCPSRQAFVSRYVL